MRTQGWLFAIIGWFFLLGLWLRPVSVRAAQELPDLAVTEARIQIDPRQAFEHASTALQLLRAQDRGRGVWYAISSEAAYLLSLPDVAMRYAADGMPYAEPGSALEQRLIIAVANALTLSGRAQDAFERLQPLGVSVSDSTLTPVQLELLVARAQAQIKRQLYRIAIADLLRAYQNAPLSGPRLVRAHVAVYLGLAYQVMDDDGRAERYLQEALSYFSEHELALWRGRCERELAQIAMRSGQWPLAQQYLHAANEHSAAVHDEQGRALAGLGLAQVAQHLGQKAQALILFQTARQIFFRTNDWITLVTIERGLATLALSEQRWQDAIGHLQQAEKFAREVNDASLLWPVLSERAELLAQRGEFADAYSDSAAAARLRDQMLEAEKDRTLAEMMVRFDSEQQEQKNTLLQQQNQLNEAKLVEHTQRNRLVLVSVLALLLVLGFMAFLIVRARAIRRELQRIAMTDELTGIANRRAIMYKLASDYERVKRYGTPLAVAMLDLDHFKHINDQLGHAAGDEVLQVFAQTLKASLRKSDDCGRIGGEEFLVLLHHAKETDVQMVVERIRVATTQMQCSKLSADFPLSVSIGLAFYTPADSNADALLKRADDAVYLAKHQGRNCVALAPEPELPPARVKHG